MRKLLALVAGIGIVVMFAVPAFAWHITPNGSAVCQENGTYLVTFTYTSSDPGETVTWNHPNPMTVPGTDTSASNTAHAVWAGTYTLNNAPSGLITLHDNGTADIHDDYWTKWPFSTHYPKYTFHAGETDTKTYVVELGGDCLPPVIIDVCPNIEGNQAEVPEGLIIDNEGDCVTPPTETPSPTPPPEIGQTAFVFSTCTDTFVRFTSNGNGWYAIDGVFTYVVITTAPQDIDLGQLPNGTVVYAGVNGLGDSTTVTVDNKDCSTQTPTPTPSPTPPPNPGPNGPPWHPTWTPAPHPVQPNGPPANTAFTGAPSNTVPLAGAAGLFAITGILALLRSRRLFGR